MFLRMFILNQVKKGDKNASSDLASILVNTVPCPSASFIFNLYFLL